MNEEKFLKINRSNTSCAGGQTNRSEISQSEYKTTLKAVSHMRHAGACEGDDLTRALTVNNLTSITIYNINKKNEKPPYQSFYVPFLSR